VRGLSPEMILILSSALTKFLITLALSFLSLFSKTKIPA